MMLICHYIMKDTVDASVALSLLLFSVVAIIPMVAESVIELGSVV